MITHKQAEILTKLFEKFLDNYQGVERLKSRTIEIKQDNTIREQD